MTHKFCYRPQKTSSEANLGDMIRQGREMLDLSQGAFAGKVGLAERTIWGIEHDEHRNPKNLRICRAFINNELKKMFRPPFPWPPENSIIPLDTDASDRLEREYRGLVLQGLHDKALDLAQTAVKRAELAHDQKLLARWEKCAAAVYRCRGMLLEASTLYNTALDHAECALKPIPADKELRYLVGKIRFGQIMVDDFLKNGAVEEAYAHHTELLKNAGSLRGDVQSAQLKKEIKLRCTHIKRQQAEMLRLCGRYEKALRKIRKVRKEYPGSAFEESLYARLSEADSLRLKGQTSEALAEYNDLLEIAAGRNLDQLQGEVLWRKVGALQSVPEIQRNLGQLAKCSATLEAIAEANVERYRYVFIYSLLTSAAGTGIHADQAERALQRVEQFGGSPTLRVGDVIGLQSLATKLNQPTGNDYVSSYLRGQFSDAVRNALASYQTVNFGRAALEQTLVKALNTIIRGPSVHVPRRFSGVTLRPETEKLLSQDVEADSLPRLNRLLLEDAYPDELSRRTISHDYLRTEYAHVALCRAEILRRVGKIRGAKDQFSKAFKYYEMMKMRWGVVRSWIGLKLTGEDERFPSWCNRSLEGLDAVLLERFKQGKEMSPGSLSANIP